MIPILIFKPIDITSLNGLIHAHSKQPWQSADVYPNHSLLASARLIFCHSHCVQKNRTGLFLKNLLPFNLVPFHQKIPFVQKMNDIRGTAILHMISLWQIWHLTSEIGSQQNSCTISELNQPFFGLFILCLYFNILISDTIGPLSGQIFMLVASQRHTSQLRKVWKL